MVNKQDAYQRAMENKAKANSINSEKVDETLPWQEEGKVEETVYTPIDSEDEVEVIDTQEDSEEVPPTTLSEGVDDTDTSIMEFADTLNGMSKTLYLTILQYMEDMQPGKSMDNKRGAIHQQRFYNAIKGMFNNLPLPEFTKLYKQVLLLFFKYKDGVFSDDYVFRFAPFWPMSEDDCQAFRSLVTLMSVTADPRTRRKVIKDIKGWNHTLRYGLNEQGKNNIKIFYSI